MFNTKTFLLGLLALGLCLSSPATRGAVVFGQVDTFQGGLANWGNGAGTVTLVASGGPNGANDAYMQILSGGPANRLVGINSSQWVNESSAPMSNYIAQGVTAIELDLNNQSAVSLSIRLAFKSDTGPAAVGYLSAPILLAPGSGWQRFTISITASDLTAVTSAGSPPPAAYATFFSNPFAEMRIIHEVGTANLFGDPVTAQLGVDNIRAVPEPATAALVLGGLAVCGAIGYRRRRARSA